MRQKCLCTKHFVELSIVGRAEGLVGANLKVENDIGTPLVIESASTFAKLWLRVLSTGDFCAEMARVHHLTCLWNI
jgi:hypothetical protein